MDQSESKPSTRGWIVGIVVVLFVICLMALAIGGYAYSLLGNSNFTSQLQSSPLNNGNPLIQPTVPVARTPAAFVSNEALNTLSQTTVPYNDLYDLACRMKNICNVSISLPAPAAPFKVGDQQKFWLLNDDTASYFQISATLRYITPHSYFWLQDGVKADDQDIKNLMDTFENKIYPTDRQFFGSEWTPGVDNDPHIYVLYAGGIGRSTGGGYDDASEYNPQVFKYSNAHEMFIFNSDNESLTSEYTYGTLAHEFQHMIHWSLDRNEDTWMNEGFSQVAMFLNGYSIGGSDTVYANSPDIPLTQWASLSTDPLIADEHYGQSFLFLLYFLDRFGPTATQALVKDKLHGLTSVDDTLKNLNITDAQTGKPITADNVVIDWLVAMYLKNGSVGDGRYTYHNYPNAPQTNDTKTVKSCPQAPVNLSVYQYGVEYIDISCTGNYTLSFMGSTEVNLLPTDPHSGNYVLWSNRGDKSDMTLTHEFDFTNVSAPIQISYWIWYEIEKGYDYAYLEASTDGQHWDVIHTPSCFDKDTSGQAYGCGYTGKSGGGDASQWLNETVDLSQYAGKKIQLRFEYVTDPALNYTGLLLDDISIPAIHYASDFETDSGGWQTNGFVRVENQLPQTFRLALILKGDKTTVQNITLTADQTAVVPISLQAGQHAILVVTGTERFTNLQAGFTIQIK
jgi:immune inhibitor A